MATKKTVIGHWPQSAPWTLPRLPFGGEEEEKGPYMMLQVASRITKARLTRAAGPRTHLRP